MVCALVLRDNLRALTCGLSSVPYSISHTCTILSSVDNSRHGVSRVKYLGI